jgi:hypothetical protein
MKDLPVFFWKSLHGCSGLFLFKHVLGRALESQRTKGDCREAMKTKGNFHFSATHSNLTTLQTNTNAAQAVRSITLAQQLKRSCAAPTNHNNSFFCHLYGSSWVAITLL